MLKHSNVIDKVAFLRTVIQFLLVGFLCDFLIKKKSEIISENEWLFREFEIRKYTNARNFILYRCVIENFEQHRNFLSDMHQNLIRTKLYQDPTKYKFY